MEKKHLPYKYRQILLIDDMTLDNFINEKTITMSHFSKLVYVTTSSISALEFLNNLLCLGDEYAGVYPEVIFIDINMPMIDGFQFIGSFKKQIERQLRKPKLVILTSSVVESDRQKALGFSKDIYFFNKPLTKEMLEQI